MTHRTQEMEEIIENIFKPSVLIVEFKTYIQERPSLETDIQPVSTAKIPIFCL